MEFKDNYSAIAEANKQRRKLQNRKNQRARRQRIKGKDFGIDQVSSSFEIRRWRVDEVDEVDDGCSQDTNTDSTAVSINYHPSCTLPSTTKSVTAVQAPSSTDQLDQVMTIHSTPQPININFPLPSDQLLHLIQFNVYRAFISIKRTINTISLDPTTCPVFGPCLDDTTRYPPNPNIPSSLAPTVLQQTQYHFPWINIMPFARLRDNLIRREGRFDNFELWRDLVGDLMSYTAAPWQRGTPFSFSASTPETEQSRGFMLENYIDTDEITAGRNGLIIWGEPHDMQSWEATPGFLTKWSWAVEGCEELVEVSNRWRIRRGAEPMRLPTSVLGTNA
ncbi:hypothetical protein FOC1_g10001906 [Fusarium oxysporum f. sp. cubense race 1]|uniref:BZIP domain-containing protein n=1 Tax=Fusarium oxysporum f. sp. cubense (strain race 1) TaxID=1229664 RepID=N4UIN6_FUSC1|nr:hypothetical protein FOC1_g10001906 [Fusarium oxysporum f. sp. cubense race 1]